MAASTVQLQVFYYSQLFDYTVQSQLYRMIGENEAENAPIIFEEFVMVMIKAIIKIITKFLNVIGYHQPDLSTNEKVYASCLQLDSDT